MIGHERSRAAEALLARIARGASRNCQVEAAHFFEEHGWPVETEAPLTAEALRTAWTARSPVEGPDANQYAMSAGDRDLEAILASIAAARGISLCFLMEGGHLPRCRCDRLTANPT